MTHWQVKALLIFAIFWSTSTTATADTPIVVGIIIDDIGYNLEKGTRALTLPGNITYSILPHTRYSRHLAQEVARSGREVMLHIPMENLLAHKLGPGGLTSTQDQQQFMSILRTALDDVPNVSGINNHMGSHLTQQPVPMGWLMDELQRRNFYFVDSLTTADSVAHLIAHEKNLLASIRDVFLDNEPNYEAIDQSFKKLIALAKSRGSAIAIGHPHRETIDYLKNAIPLLKKEGVQLLPASSVAVYQTLDAKLPLLATRNGQQAKTEPTLPAL